jgi:hypothetical protein
MSSIAALVESGPLCICQFHAAGFVTILCLFDWESTVRNFSVPNLANVRTRSLPVKQNILKVPTRFSKINSVVLSKGIIVKSKLYQLRQHEKWPKQYGIFIKKQETI